MHCINASEKPEYISRGIILRLRLIINRRMQRKSEVKTKLPLAKAQNSPLKWVRERKITSSQRRGEPRLS